MLKKNVNFVIINISQTQDQKMEILMLTKKIKSTLMSLVEYLEN